MNPITWIKNKLHQHNYDACKSSWAFTTGNLVMIRQYVCSCGFEHPKSSTLVASLANMIAAEENESRINQGKDGEIVKLVTTITQNGVSREEGW